MESSNDMLSEEEKNSDFYTCFCPMFQEPTGGLCRLTVPSRNVFENSKEEKFPPEENFEPYVWFSSSSGPRESAYACVLTRGQGVMAAGLSQTWNQIGIFPRRGKWMNFNNVHRV